MRTVYQQVGRRVREIRKRRGLTQSTLGERAGITPDYLGRIERGRGAATLETLGRIAAALSTPLRQLLDVEEIASASREEILKSIQSTLRKKGTEELRKIYAVLEAMEFR
jgi:transcriptional regulator with XRE-family HTH domain